MKGIIYWYVDMAIPRSETRLNRDEFRRGCGNISRRTGCIAVTCPVRRRLHRASSSSQRENAKLRHARSVCGSAWKNDAKFPPQTTAQSIGGWKRDSNLYPAFRSR